MIKIKKVIADPYFKKEYYQINDDIMEKNYAYKTGLGEFLEQFEKGFLKAEKEVRENFSVTAQFRIFPSAEKMVESIDEKVNEIIKKLKLNEIKCEHSKIVKAMVLAHYLIKQFHYDMTTHEFMNNSAIELDKQAAVLRESIVTLKDRYAELFNKQIKLGLDGDEQNEVLHLVNHIQKAYESYESAVKKAEQTIINTAIYDALIYNRGVCSNFSYTYEYILNKLQIKSYLLQSGTEVGHIFNIVEGEQKNKYYIVDLTATLIYRTNGIATILSNFGLTKKEKEVDLGKLVAIWERQLNSDKDAVYNIIENKESLEKVKDYISNRQDLNKQLTIAKTFIEVKLKKEEMER